MIVIDKRIGFNYCVQIEAVGCDIDIMTLKDWLEPFFSVQEEAIDEFKIIAKIMILKEMQEDYVYSENIFYINTKLSSNKLFYTLMSILRILYKYVAHIIGYQNLHAACLRYNNKGILIIAGRNQGKTTMVLNAIQDAEFLLLANDQVMYNIENNQLIGYPAAVGVRDSRDNSAKQEQIKRNALWFIEDPYQTQLKPVIHIKELSKIYQCEVVASAKLEVLIRYQKSEQIDELTINDIGKGMFFPSKIELPFESVYKKELLNACECSINFYVGKTINSKKDIKHRDNIRQVQITCGIARMKDMLREVKAILE